MTDSIAAYITTKLKELNFVETAYGICEQVKEEGFYFPAFYTEQGDRENVTDFDSFFGGVSYLRKDGKVGVESADSMIGGAEAVKLSVPLKLVMFVPKKNLSEDDAYSDDRVALAIIKKITGKDLKNDVSAMKSEINFKSWETDRNTVLNDEYRSDKMPGIYPEYVYLSMELNVELTIKKSCLNDSI